MQYIKDARQLPGDIILEIERVNKPQEKDLQFLQSRYPSSLKEVRILKQLLLFKHYVMFLREKSCYFIAGITTNCIRGEVYSRRDHSLSSIHVLEQLASVYFIARHYAL